MWWCNTVGVVVYVCRCGGHSAVAAVVTIAHNRAASEAVAVAIAAGMVMT